MVFVVKCLDIAIDRELVISLDIELTTYLLFSFNLIHSKNRTRIKGCIYHIIKTNRNLTPSFSSIAFWTTNRDTHIRFILNAITHATYIVSWIYLAIVRTYVNWMNPTHFCINNTNNNNKWMQLKKIVAQYVLLWKYPIWQNMKFNIY